MSEEDAPPPSYDAAASTSFVAGSSKAPASEKSSLPHASTSSSPYLTPTHSPKPSTSSSSSKASFASPLFGLLPSKSTREVRTTVKALIQDIIVQQSPAEACRGILQSCAESCKAYDIPLHSILQERYMEEHTPLYWAIVKRAEEYHSSSSSSSSPNPDPSDPSDTTLLLLALAAPLTADTIADIRAACLVFSDNALFQRLRMAPEFSSLSPAEQILFNGEAMVPDSVRVEDVKGEGAFVAHIRIPKFQRRMRVAGTVGVEFVALGRIFCLAFLITPQNVRRRHPHRPGSWCLSLSLMDNSSPTFFNGRLIVPDARRTAKSADARLKSAVGDTKSSRDENPSLADTNRASSSASPASDAGPRRMPGGLTSSTGRPQRDLVIPLKSDEELVPMTRFRGRRRNDEILVELEEGAGGLQFSGTPYLHEDDTLVAHLEAKLAKPDDYECVIC
ncbi:uncharacterized protein SCHCODRAFT_01087415 [Schizophyllum commune H4-8]|nr:uncharacterized protein SCHCODRAFT_01087415 [Schizophyllum commune H4-8]KAI5900305.1 hypothetical protein SCHCODRAFT_01087415 [Schizophyllum commune H4-8]